MSDTTDKLLAALDTAAHVWSQLAVRELQRAAQEHATYVRELEERLAKIEQEISLLRQNQGWVP